MKCRSLFLCCLIVNSVLHAASPTEMREWQTSSGHKAEASALQVEDGTVHLKMGNGKLVKLAMDKLVESDQKFLQKHFAIPDATEPAAGSDAKPAEGLAYPLGQMQGPVDAGGGASYFVYLPKSLKQDRPAPLIFFCAPWGAKKPGFIKGMTDVADRFGWVVALSVNSSNAHSMKKNSDFCKKSLDHLFGTLPLDEKRVHYAGHSGGGAQSYVNASFRPAYGVMPSAGYVLSGVKPRAEVVYAIGGGYDFNRYTTANAVAGFKKNGFHRISPKGHPRAANSYREDGVFWMACRYLGEQKSEHLEEAKDFERAALIWLKELQESHSMRAYSNAMVFKEYYQPEGHNGRALELLIKELEKTPDNKLYHEALHALDEFSDKYLAGSVVGSAMNRVDPKVARGTEKLRESYGHIPEIAAILDALNKKTDSLKK
ncbi:SHD1 domain-containing protein [Oceaniferula flava]|nr:SHD1 domain-containing protein [Oceaniferula flavus]